jgi:excisionase family DNA binding protein
VLTTKQAAARLRVSSETVRRWYRAGILDGNRMNPTGRIKIHEQSVERLLARVKLPPKEGEKQ